ncbi:winged helix-turn-helix transcriptional regulator [Nocardia carnea]
MADSIARTSDVSGEPWSPLTLRSVWAGVRRLDDIRAELGISRKALAERLSHSVEHGVVDRETCDHRPRFDYVSADSKRDGTGGQYSRTCIYDHRSASTIEWTETCTLLYRLPSCFSPIVTLCRSALTSRL